MNWVAVAVGGALGAVLRYGLSGWVQGVTGAFFPWGTLAVNVLGSFILGAGLHLGTERFLFSTEARLLLTTGFCGSLTTFSTFSFETYSLLEEQQWAAAGGNIALNVALCLAFTYAGVVAARLI